MVQISKPAIPITMYRHFAVVTVALTAILALFAQGDHAEMADRQAANNPPTAQSSRPVASTTPAYGQPVLTYDTSLGGSQGFDESASGPAEITRANTGSNSLYVNSSNQLATGSENAGLTRAYLDTLSDEELAQLADEMQRMGMSDPSKRAQAVQVMEAASRRRSGRAAAIE